MSVGDRVHRAASAVVACLLLAGCQARVVTFEQRAQVAETLEETPTGKAYTAALVGSMMPIVKDCIDATGDSTAFALVADVDAAGNLHAVEARPASGLGSCVAAKLAPLRAPAPPPGRGGNYPVVVALEVSP